MNPILWRVEYFDPEERRWFLFHFDSEQKAMEKFVLIVNSKPIEKRERLEVIALDLWQARYSLDLYSNAYARIMRRKNQENFLVGLGKAILKKFKGN